MQRLKDAFESWNNFVADREVARSNAIGFVDLEKQGKLANKLQQQAALKAEIALLKAELGMGKTTYHKGSFDALWTVEKRKRSDALDEAIREELGKGKSGYELANALGTKSINRFYEVKRGLTVHQREQVQETEQVSQWQWSRFTGTQRYALGHRPHDEVAAELKALEPWEYVLMHGALGTALEGQQCVWDFRTGAFVDGELKVFNSDSETNRRKRADTLAEILAGTYAGKVKETPNPYFEVVEDN